MQILEKVKNSLYIKKPNNSQTIKTSIKVFIEMEKIAYIGLSGPTNYDYINTASPTRNDISSSPNPILENAFGLAIFYDEIWFLCESLCPNSLRGHPRIKYIDEILKKPPIPTLKKKLNSH